MGGTGVDWKTIFGVLGLLILFSLLNRCERDKRLEGEGIVRSVKTDTVVVVRYDTLVVSKLVPVERLVVDTVYLSGDISLPVERLRYSKENEYDIWVSGIKASVDSVRFYAPAIERTVTRTITVERKDGSWACVPYMGFKAFSGSVSPNIGLMLETPKSWVLGAEIGYSKAHKAYWGVNIGHRFGK